jgi:hypothetical protein
MSKTYAVKGDWNTVCDVCGFKYKASQLKDRWDGLKVCKEDWEVRHPSDYYKFPTGAESVVPWTRPEPSTESVAVTYTGSTTTDVPDGTNNGTL